MPDVALYRSSRSFSHILHGADFCEHCSANDLSAAVGYFYEQENGQYVFAEIVCEVCRLEAQKVIDETPETCEDCHHEVPHKDVRYWRPYYFHAPSGDVPATICKACWELPKHQERMKKDDEDYRAEMDEPDDHDDVEDDDDFDGDDSFGT